MTNQESAISIALDPAVFEPGKLTDESGAVRRVTTDALRGKGRCPEHYTCPARLCIVGIEFDSPIEARHGAIVLRPVPITESQPAMKSRHCRLHFNCLFVVPLGKPKAFSSFPVELAL